MHGSAAVAAAIACLLVAQDQKYIKFRILLACFKCSYMQTDIGCPAADDLENILLSNMLMWLQYSRQLMGPLMQFTVVMKLFVCLPPCLQITGQPSVLYYASQIFERAGFASGQEAAGVSVLLGTFKLVMTLVAVATVDKLGRRPLLLGGVGGMVVALLLLTAAQGGVDAAAASTAADAVGGAAWLSAVALLLYVGCYQVSIVGAEMQYH